MISKIRLFLLGNKKACYLLCACLLISITGCSRTEILPPENNLSVDGIQNDGFPPKPNGMGEEVDSPKHNHFSEAYLNMLFENRSMLTNENISDMQTGMIMDICDGKIAVLDVFGNGTPELMYIYTPTPSDICEYLAIFTYSKTDGIELVFNSQILAWAGGGNNYCVYLDCEGELKAYYSTFGAGYSYGFWPIVSLSKQEQEEQRGFYFYDENTAKLFYSSYFEDPNEEIIAHLQYGNEISKEEFNKTAKELMDNIDRVIFQSNEIGEYGLYEREDLWENITPFEAEFMTYDEAIVWLKEQVAKQ